MRGPWPMSDRERPGRGTSIDFRFGCDEWREVMGLARHGALGEILPTTLIA